MNCWYSCLDSLMSVAKKKNNNNNKYLYIKERVVDPTSLSKFDSWLHRSSQSTRFVSIFKRKILLYFVNFAHTSVLQWCVCCWFLCLRNYYYFFFRINVNVNGNADGKVVWIDDRITKKKERRSKRSRSGWK